MSADRGSVNSRQQQRKTSLLIKTRYSGLSGLYDELRLRLARAAGGSYTVLADAADGGKGRGSFAPPVTVDITHRHRLPTMRYLRFDAA